MVIRKLSISIDSILFFVCLDVKKIVKYLEMGKGDKKSKKGKISKGSSGVRRQKKSNQTQVEVISSKKTSNKKEVKATVAKKTAAKKPSAKKPAAKKTAAKKQVPKK